MAKGVGFNRFLLIKSQTAWGTRATGLTGTMVPLREGSIFDANPLLQPREDVIATMSPVSQYYTAPKFVPWGASFLLVNPTSAAPTVRDLLRTTMGLEVLATGPPITKTYTINDPPIDGGTDTGTNLYGRGLTLHEQCDDSAGTKIYADVVQDAIINELTITFRPDMPVRIGVRGMASDLQPGGTDTAPTIPAGQLFTYRHLRDQTNAGLRIGTANPPTSSDKVIFSQATITVTDPMRYANFMGNGTTQEATLPVRDGQMGITLDVLMDVDTATASQYDADDASAHWAAGTPINARLLAYIDANNIFEFATTGSTAGCFVESYRRVAQGLGAMQYNLKVRMGPAALGDTLFKLTTAS